MTNLRPTETRQILDGHIDRACLSYSETIQAVSHSTPFEALVDKDAVRVDRALKAFNEAALHLAFYADARFQVDAEIALIDKSAWADVAKTGFKRLAKRDPSRASLDKISLFNAGQAALQTELYDDMHARRGVKTGAVQNEWAGLRYATRVAMGEIVLFKPLLENN